MNDPVVVTHPAPGVAQVTLDRADTLNSLDLACVDALAEVCRRLAAADLHTVVFAGAGRGFCSGAHLPMIRGFIEEDHDLPALMRRLGSAYVALRQMPQVTIAAVHGPAIGAGWGWVLGCDLAFAGPQARFAATFIRMGLGPDYGVSQTLPWRVGREEALELLLTGRVVDASEALRLGLVRSIHADPLAEALAFAGALSDVPARAVRSIKSSLDRSETADIVTVVDEIEAHAQAALLGDPDFAADAHGWLTRR